MGVFQRYACVLVAITTIYASTPAQAGFELTTGSPYAAAPAEYMQAAQAAATEPSAAQPATAASPLVITNVPQVPTEEDYNVAKGIDGDAPALKVFEERYIPDSVRSKYNLSEGQAPQAQVAEAPVVREVPALEVIAPQNIAPAAGTDIPRENPTQLTIIGKEKPAPAMAAIATKPSIVKSWRARKGENVRDILRRWSERQNVDLMWASAETPSLQKDFSYVGKFQDAVNNLLKQTGGSELHSQFRTEGMDPVMMSPASSITTNLPVPEEGASNEEEAGNMSLSSAFEPSAPKTEQSETRWFGLSGAPLAEVLNVWAEDAGAKVVWQAENNYALRESISQKGSFEDAVYRALSQYENQKVRPVGQMFVAPNGERVLVISTDASTL